MVVMVVTMAVPVLFMIVPTVFMVPASAMIGTAVLVGDQEVNGAALASRPGQFVGR